MSSEIDSLFEDLFGNDGPPDISIYQHAEVSGLFIAPLILSASIVSNIGNDISQFWFCDSQTRSQFIVFGRSAISKYSWIQPVLDAAVVLLKVSEAKTVCISDNIGDTLGHEFDHLLANYYAVGDGIKDHIDLKRFGDAVVVACFGSTCIMEFKQIGFKDSCIEVFLNPGDMICMTGDSRYNFTHGIPERTVDVVDGLFFPRKDRVSITLRTMIDLSFDS
ncbi:hypothetical protein HK096_010090 [Nowakowskiella sp. JEL0078]|nr:hypothetical protein HK096_010090 [Nowakowskiella sp. JEL0078]